MVDPENPTAPVQVVLAPKGYREELWDMARKQGPLTLILLVAVYVLWGQLSERDLRNSETVKKVAEQHAEAVKQITSTSAASLKEQAQVFQSEQDRTERILGQKINIQARHIDDISRKVDALMP